MISEGIIIKIFKTVGAVAGIGGIALVVFWSLYGQLINEHMLKKISPNISGPLIGAIIIFTFLISILSLFAGFYKQRRVKPVWFILLVIILLSFFVIVLALFLFSEGLFEKTNKSLLYEGYKLYKNGDLAKADEIIDESIKNSPNSPESFFWKAKVSLKRGNNEAALHYATMASECDSSHPHSTILKIKVLLIMGGEKIMEAKKQSKKKYNNLIVYSWIDCLWENNFFSKSWISETEIDGRCKPPAYQWN